MLSHGFMKSLRKKCPEESFLEAVAQWMGRRLGYWEAGIDVVGCDYTETNSSQ